MSTCKLLSALTAALIVLLPVSAPQASQGAGEIAAIRRAVFEDPQAPVMGNPKGSRILVAFSDYNCGFCRKVTPQVAALIATDPQLKVVVHEVPIFGEGSRYAAMAALAAGEQGRYAQFHRALMASRGKLDAASVLRVAREAGLDVPRLERDMQAPAIAAQIEQSLALADRIGLVGTPSFIAGDRAVFGYLSQKDLAALVAEAHPKP